MYVISGEVLVVTPVLKKLKRQAMADEDSAYERAKGAYFFFYSNSFFLFQNCLKNYMNNFALTSSIKTIIKICFEKIYSLF